jgi:hypothetical protein
MAQNPFNPASNTANIIASATPQTDQFANFSGQNNPFNPQPPKPTSIANVSGNQFRLNMPGVSEQPDMSRAPTATPTVKPVSLDAGAPSGMAAQNPTAPVPGVGAQAYSTQSTAANQQSGLIRGAVRPV